MRIAVFHNLPSGGGKRHMFEQICQLSRRGYELTEFAPSTADVAFCSLEKLVLQQRIYSVENGPSMAKRIRFVTPYINAARGLQTLSKTERANRSIAADIDRGRFDIVLAYDCHIVMNPYVLRHCETPSLFQRFGHGLRNGAEGDGGRTTEASSMACRLRHVYYAPARALFGSKLKHDERRNICAAARVVTNSQFSRTLLAREYGVEAGVIYPGIDALKFRPVSDAVDNYVLSVGALIYAKGHRFIVEALSMIPTQSRPPLFIAANSIDGVEQHAIQRLAAERGVRLHIETITDDGRLVEVYSRARALVYAPVQEALGLAPLEAAACETPVVAVADGGVRETVINGVTGWLVERDPGAFAERLQQTLSCQREARDMARVGREWVIREWGWTAAVDRLEAELQRLAAS